MKSIFCLTVTVFFIFQRCGLAMPHENDVDSTQRPKNFEDRPFEFDYNNVTDQTVWVSVTQVLIRNVAMGRVWAKKRGHGISTSRGNCTPDAMLDAKVKFRWWKMNDPYDIANARRIPDDPRAISEYAMALPEFDDDAIEWNCLFTLLADETWAGHFQGVVLKPPRMAPERKQKEGAKWIQYQFRNLTAKEVKFLDFAGKTTILVCNNKKTPVVIPNIPPNGKFVGFIAHSREGSIYRPTSSTTIELVWNPTHTGQLSRQTIDFPEFSPELDNWYCYFTLNANNTWTVEFEGVKQ